MRRSPLLIVLLTVSAFNQLLLSDQVPTDMPDVVKSAAEHHYPPFCIVTPDGKADGFSVELLKASLAEVYRKVEFKTGTWSEIKQDLSDGVIQVLPLVGRTPEREAMYDFTFPYLTLHGAVFVRKGDDRIKDVADIHDKKVAVMKGDNAEEFCRRTDISSQIVALETYSDAMQLLADGGCDAVIAQRIMGLYLLRTEGIDGVVTLPFDLSAFRQDFCFAVHSGDKVLLSRLNEGLSTVIADGTFDDLYKKWFGPIIPHELSLMQLWEQFSAVVLSAVALLSLLVLLLLRFEVQRKTKHLAQEIEERTKTEHELKASESKYASLFENMLNGFALHRIITDDDGDPVDYEFLEINNAFEKLTGLKREDVIGTTVRSSIPGIEQDPIDWIGEYGRVALTGEELRMEQFSEPLSRWYSIYAYRPEESLFAVIFEDITKRKQSEEREKELQQKLARAEKMESIGVLAGGVAHDLNNVLGPMVLLPDIISEDLADSERPNSEEIAESLNVIKTSANRAARIVKDLVSLGRRANYNLAPLNINEYCCIAGGCSHLKIIGTVHPGVTITHKLAKEPLIISADGSHLSRVIHNLLQNGAESIDKKGKVTLSTSKKSIIEPLNGYETVPEGDYAIIEISDTGTGIDEEFLAQMFEPFVTRKKNTDRSGSGLGLSVVHGIIKDHNGFIDVSSEVGKGSVFTLYFPLIEQLKETEETSAPATIEKGTERILIIDDEPAVRFTGRVSLERLGYKVAEAENGNLALEYFEKAKGAGEESPYDLIILDMIMEPSFDGLQTYEAIRELFPKQKAIMCSGFAEGDRTDAAHDLGVDWLAKPYKLNELAMAVRKGLDTK